MTSSQAKLGNLEADFLAAALALKEKKKDTVLPPIFRHVDPDLVVPGTNKRKEAGPAWIEEDQYEYESSDDDEVVVGNDRHHVGYCRKYRIRCTRIVWARVCVLPTRR